MAAPPQTERLPVVGITMGDAAGIGPEVVAKALAHPELYTLCRPLVIGDARVFAPFRDLVDFHRLDAEGEGAALDLEPGTAALLDLGVLDPATVPMGKVSAAAGHAAVLCVLEAARRAMSGALDAIATAPLNKEAMHRAGHEYIGHTELLADVTGTEHCTTMLATPGLRVTHVTRHVPFREISAHLSRESVLRTIAVTHAGMRDLGYTRPRVAVAGLNPHNGEGGLLGREEIDVITPAVADACAQGIDAQGPLPADSVFFQAIRGDYDVVVTMYHDQGHIAVKTHGFERSITITLGLPIVRTSADHGTAFDIAGQGIAGQGIAGQGIAGQGIAGQGVADESSMLEAILEAARIAQRRGAGD